MESAVFTVYCSLFVLVTQTTALAAPKKLYFIPPGGCKAKANCSNGLGECDADSNRCVCVNSTVTADGCASRSFQPNNVLYKEYNYNQTGHCVEDLERDTCYWYFGGRCSGDRKDPKCECPEHHFFDGRICVKSFFTSGECKADGTTCSNGNGKCFGGVCACKKNFYAAVQEGKCVTSYFTTGEKCPKGSDCWLGRDLQPGRCQGDNTTCRCPDSSFAVGRRCVRDFLEQLCGTGEPCGGGDGQCDSSGRCVCKDGYYVQGAFCRALSFKPKVACSPNGTCSEGDGKCQTDGSCLCTGEYFVHKGRCVVAHYNDSDCTTCRFQSVKCHLNKFCMCMGDGWVQNGLCVGTVFSYPACVEQQTCSMEQGTCIRNGTCKCNDGLFVIQRKNLAWICTSQAKLPEMSSKGSLAALPDLWLLALTITVTTFLRVV
ncbi:hypothetical protein BaRGS_00033204 [Batillaria attramentaria]|uniref:EGF-like domain-containing protein n=1 Tax=Batillaria attramentaria TaxID=370345 RepID=A0ABD0JL46_9CAEN